LNPILELTQLICNYYVTGFTDAASAFAGGLACSQKEGCFLIRKSKNKLGWQQNSSNSSIANSAQLKFVLDPWFITG
jgi:hypothetical protein